MRPALLLVAALALFPGCATREEAVCPVERPYVSIHYADPLDPEPLRTELVGRGWRWDQTGRDTVVLTPPAGLYPEVRGVFSGTPGASGLGQTVLSVEGGERTLIGDRGVVDAAASDLAAVVNGTYGTPTIERWIAGVHTTPCP